MKRHKSTGICAAITLLVMIQVPSVDLQSEEMTAGLNLSQHVIEPLGSMPVVFTENAGQWDERVRFRANAGAATIWFTDDAICHQFTHRNQQGDNEPRAVGHSDDPIDPDPDRFEQLVVKAIFVGANPQPEVIGADLMEYKCNYFIGNDREKWHTDVPSYRSVLYKDIYPGIDLKYFSNGKELEYDFIVSPGADPSQIRVRYEEAESLSINESGELEVDTEWNTLTEGLPCVYQETGSDRKQVSCEYRLLEDNSFCFTLADRYDLSRPLIIDPTVVFSTYLGGDSEDRGYAIAVDDDGNTYVTGTTWSADFPTENPYQIDQTSNDVFVTKLSGEGNSLIYSTYIGGVKTDAGQDIAVDGYGNAYVTGYTSSYDYPTENAYQEWEHGYPGVFVTKLSSEGNSLVYSTYLGSDGRGSGIAVDSYGNAYVTGHTDDRLFPVENHYQIYQGGNDVFVTKFSTAGNSLVYSTYLGGEGDDRGRSTAIDGSGNAYVTGYTDSWDFPTKNHYQTEQGGEDVFVTKLSSAGNSLVYSTHLGGGDNDRGEGITVDGNGNAYITGYTSSPDFPTKNPYQTDQSGDDVFVTRLSSAGNSLTYSTYLGGESSDHGCGIAVDGCRNVYVTGRTGSTDFPTHNAYQIDTDGGYYDAFVAKLSTAGNNFVYSTYLGGGANDEGQDVAVDGDGTSYVVGGTSSSDFPTQNPYQTDQPGYDVVVTKLSSPAAFVCGDANGSGEIDLDDVLYLISYIFVSGPEPDQCYSGDADCSGDTSIDDVVYLITYLFSGGNAPCDADGDGSPDCWED